MAESPVLSLLERLTNLLQQEIHLQSGVRAEIRYIRDELERLKAFLRFADALEDTDPELKVWVKQARDVAHDMEDILDEYTIRLMHHQGHGQHASFHRLYDSVMKMKARHQIGVDIQSIKSRVKVISKGRHTRDEQVHLGSSSSHPYSSQSDGRGDALLLEEADLVGIEKPKKQLIDLLFREGAGREVISICGMGGLGKTTLAKQVYEDAKVKKRFRIHAWITISQPFRMDELLKDMVQQLFNVIGKPAPPEVWRMKNEKLKEVIKNLLQQNRYLIVLDDLWRVNAWDAVKHALPNNNHGCRIIITTRNKEVASSCCSETHGKVYHLDFLPKEAAWSLFCRKTFQGHSCPTHLAEVCECILEKCAGLPLAIVAISGALATKDRNSIEEWQMVCRSIAAEIEVNDKLENLNQVLSLSFSDLPYYLKSCLLYFSIFPDFYAIEHRRLIRLWVAEGFVSAEEGRTKEEVATVYLKELINRSLVQVVEKTNDGRVKTCRIHGLLREIINLKSRDQNFATIAKEQDIVWPDQVRRLSVLNALQNIQPDKTTFKLRSLLMFGVADSLDCLPMTSVIPHGFRLLRVLDFQGASLEVFPEEIVSLFLLRYLSLKATKVRNIPASIKKLQNLETLDLKHSNVTELPIEILTLQKLRHLLVYRYEIESYAYFHSKHGFKALPHIGCMQSLQRLCFIEAGKGSEALLTELGMLTQLRRLGIRKLRQEDGAALCSSIEKLTSLRSLSIHSAEEDEILDLQNISSPPKFLQRLYLSGRLETFPQWIRSLHSLVRICLKWTRLKEDPLAYLQDLPNLVHLELLKVFVGETLSFRAKGFQSLKLLVLDDLDELKSVEVEEGAMPSLKWLIIQRCGMLRTVPSGIEHLTKLKVIEFFDMPNELISALHPPDGKDYWRVQHVPAVYSIYWRNACWDVYSLETFGEEESSSNPATALRSHELRTLWKV